MELTTEWLALADYEAQDLPELSVPDWAVTVKVSIARRTTPTPDIWPNASTFMEVNGYCSVDDGASWGDCGYAGGSGDIQNGRFGERTETAFQAEIPPGTGRKYSGYLNVINGPLHSSITTTFRDS